MVFPKDFNLFCCLRQSAKMFISSKFNLKCITLLTIPIVFCNLLTVFRAPINRVLMQLKTKSIDLVTTRAPLSLRELFDSQMLPSDTCPKNHPHPVVAGHRSKADAFINNFCSTYNLSLHSISGSKKDGRNGLKFDHAYYFPKDLLRPSNFDSLNDVDAFKMIDVDYYVDLRYYLSYMKPIFLYTIIPQALSSSSDSTFQYFSNNYLYTKVIGGGTYCHELWDYNKEFLLTHYHSYTYVFRISHRKIHNDRVVVLLEPISKIFALGRLFEDNLHRIKTDFGPVNMLQNKDKVWLSLKDNPRDTVLLSEQTLSRLIQLVINVPKTTQATFERLLDDPTDRDYAKKVTPMVYAIVKSSPQSLLLNVRTDYSLPEVDYQPLGKFFYEEPKPSGRAYMPGYLDEAFFPMTKSHNSDSAAIDGRIKNVKPVLGTIDNFVAQSQDEFITLIMQYEDQLIPKTFEEIDEVQDKPNQRRTFDYLQWCLFPVLKKASSFLKREPAQKLASPRNITNCSPEHRIRFSCYTLAAVELLKTTPWYAFGHTLSLIHI